MGKYENKAVIRGNVESDASLNPRKTAASFYIFTNHYHTDKNGDSHKHTERHRIVAFGKNAVIAEEVARKGALVEVEGMNTSRMRTDVDNPHPVYEVRAFKIKDASFPKSEEHEEEEGAQDEYAEEEELEEEQD